MGNSGIKGLNLNTQLYIVLTHCHPTQRNIEKNKRIMYVIIVFVVTAAIVSPVRHVVSTTGFK